MRPLLLCVWAVMSIFSSTAQPKYFEGTIVYHSSIHSKTDYLSVKDMYKLLAAGPEVVIDIKDGNLRGETGRVTVYNINKDKRQYYKFPGLDTLYFLEYSSDTSAVTEVIRGEAPYKIYDISCLSISLVTRQRRYNYYYSPSLRLDPAYDKDNSINKYNVYSGATGGALYLWTHSEFGFADQTDSCIRVERKKVDDHTFDLPALPLRPYDPTKMIFVAKPSEEGKTWQEYVQTHIDRELTVRVLKIPEGQREAVQNVVVEFVVGKDGTLSDAVVINKNEVIPELAEESLRLIRDSPKWLPSVFYGEHVAITTRQTISFIVKN